MRAGLFRLLVWVAVGHAIASAVWAQNGPLNSFPSGEQAVGEKPPPASSPAPGPLPDEPPASGKPKSPVGPAVESSQLDTFWLRDAKGNLVPVLGMAFEEFEQLLKLKKGLAGPQQPEYTLDALKLSGTVDERVVTLQLTATVRVRGEGWVRVPLQLAAATVLQAPRYEGPGEAFLTFDRSTNEHVAWIKGNLAAPHVLTLQMAASLAVSGDEHRLSLDLPRATESSLRLSLPQANVEAVLRSGDGIVSRPKAGMDQSEILVTGPAGAMQLAWHDARQPQADQPALLDANGTILVRVESEHRITGDAHLRIRSFGGPLETFQVRLPPGMELVPIHPLGYTLTTLTTAEETHPPPEQNPGQLIEVRLDKPATSATDVRLLATLQPDVEFAGGFRPAQFEVLGAVRQRGTIDISMDGEWQLEWTEDSSVRRLDAAADAAAPRLVARYDYFRQPCGLQLRVKARPSRVSVEPSHIIHVEAGQLHVESTFKVRFRGSRASGVAFAVGDWKFDRLSPDDLFDAPVTSAAPDHHLEIPFRPGSVVPAELELKLEAHRLLASPIDRLQFTLPHAIADTIAPATAVIDIADNIELAPNVDEIVGLSPEPSSARIPFRQQPPLLYRDLGGGEPALFAAAMRVRQRTTLAAGHTDIRLDRQQLQVEQRLEYHIAHEAQRTFMLAAPRELTAVTGLTLLLNNETVSATPLAESASQDASSQRLEITAPAAQIGTVQITIRYARPLPSWDAQTPLPLTVPLIVPADEEQLQFTGQQVNFTLAEGLEIEPDVESSAEVSRPAEKVRSDSSGSFMWKKALTATQWVLTPVVSRRAAEINIQKAWIQSWVSNRVRQERIALKLSTAQESLRVRLPTGVLLASVQAAINAQSIVLHIRDPGMARIDLPASARGRDFVLELWYAMEPPARSFGLLDTQLLSAQIDGAAPPRRTYWQLLLPADEHLLIAPRELETEMALRPNFWTPGTSLRRPLLDQLQLESWIGASRQDPVPRGANEYLYGALGRLPEFRLLAVNRRLLVAIGSGGALIVGLLLLHVRWLRSVSVVFTLALALAVLSLVSPDLALLVGQWSALGAIVALGATLWTWLGSGHVPAFGAAKTAEIVRPRESASTHAPIPRPDRAAPLSTATAPAGIATEVRQ